MPAKLLANSSLSTPPDTYLYTLARTGSSAYATIGSDDSLRIFNIPSLTLSRSYPSAHKGIACLITAPDGTNLITAGRDGFIRFWDPRTPSTKPFLEIREPKGAGFSALACAGNFLAAGTESAKEGLGDVSVLVYDLRNPGVGPLRSFVESHTDSVTQLQWHPTQKNLLLSGSTDGLASVFDAEVAEEEDALMQVLNPRSAVHCAGFLPGGEQVYALSTDEQFWVYGLEKSGTAEEEALPVKEFGDVRGELGCMYVVDVVRESFMEDPVFAYGHNEKQTLGIVRLKGPGWEFGERIELPGAHGEEVVRDLKFVDEGRVVSCGEDGMVRLWAVGGGDGGEGAEVGKSAEAGKGAEKVSKKAKRKGKKESERFAPY
jgi:WD40 repeat protein